MSIVIFGFVSIWGIGFILKLLHINLFDFVYVIIISQLSLIGPVVVGLYTQNKRNGLMWIAIVIALIVGFGSIVLGEVTDLKYLIDGAATFSVITSLLVAWVVHRVF
ncbi:MAG: hypothetical protein ACMG6E_03585 [Candidatus Roizmanbacteria bacterium]